MRDLGPHVNLADGRDPGLQPERTTLAWRRTLLTAVCTLLLCLRAATTASSPALLGVVGLVLVTIGVLASCSIVRARRYRRNPHDPRPMPDLGPAAVSVSMALGAGVCLTQLL
ncbi:DUF202 domain-containing protein [Rhodococcus sp. JVH1]|uniref:DUF202 domain-containing protein n=1 Tax=Rhodococcus sp. JVH1 TaxID=745408 RepID=UPI000A057A02|nr:DUF202 domain-containing protein [Rhodococcus sp. JVH1]